MAILRKTNKEQYTSIPQDIFRDKRLSLKDIGLLTCMLSLPDNWEFSENGLEAIFPNDGITSIRTGLKKLEQTGYLSRKRKHGGKGKFAGVVWYLSDTPSLGFPKLDNPKLDNPKLEKPSVENQPQSNTKESNTKESNTKESNTKEDSSGMFEVFWKAYPRKEKKQDAKKAFMKLKPSEDLFKAIMAGLENHKKSEQWTRDKGQYIPHPTTWLNGKRWEDELESAQAQQQPDKWDGESNPFANTGW